MAFMVSWFPLFSYAGIFKVAVLLVTVLKRKVLKLFFLLPSSDFFPENKLLLLSYLDSTSCLPDYIFKVNN